MTVTTISLPAERAHKLAQLYDERNGGERMTRYVERVVTDDERARLFTGEFRSWLYPRLLQHERRIQLEEDRGIEAAG